jgi:hypothetical protein
MVNCNEEDCNKRAMFAFKNEKAIYCGQHRKNNMVDVIHKMCIKCNIKRPNYGLDGEIPTYCKDCKTPDMVDINHPKCVKCQIKRPTYNLEGEKLNIVLIVRQMI